MPRKPSWIAALGLPPAREYWRALDQLERRTAQALRDKRRAWDKPRPRCTCPAYPWPHRPAGGLCCHPDPPTAVWQPKQKPRRYRNRYAGLRRQIARANGLHPIKDRAAIDSLIPKAIQLAKRAHSQHPKALYRTAVLTKSGIKMTFPAG
jgi:hypothetical protein